jgi:uncharacterized protein (DUF2147 family)
MLGLIGFALAAAPPGVTGDWVNADRTAVIRVAPCETMLCGAVIRVLVRGPNVPSTDVHNPDPRLRSRPFVGLRVLTGFTRSGAVWSGGRAYDPKTGKSYRARLALNPDGTLKVTGCIMIFCRSQQWTRVRR